MKFLTHCRILTNPFQFSDPSKRYSVSIKLNLSDCRSFRTFFNSFSLFLCGICTALFLHRFRFRFSDARPRIRILIQNSFLPRKEVIQPHLPIRLPCYDFTPVIGLTLDGCLLAVNSPASGAPNSHGVTGGVYKARERIHRGMLIRDY